MEIFDIHHHLGALTGGSLQEGVGWQDRDYANRVRIMEANGVTHAAILAATGYIQADGIKDTMRANDVVAAYRTRDPERFPVACGTVEPLHGSRSLGELDRIVFFSHYEQDAVRGSPRSGWAHVLTIRDLGRLTVPPATESSQAVAQVWRSNWSGLGDDDAAAEAISDSIDRAREDVLQVLASLQ